ncbi:alpha/beta hydrolase [Candidatus Poriferisocius sp.]|uniref:alpha/beta hydrolase n=1 Tax=Candidatus Poriferisocius sp. TaxID=3101276 RepID=UPI003B5220DF
MIVRGLHFSFDAHGDAALATLLYPGDDGRLDEARLTGQVPAIETGALWPVVVIMPGINVAPDSYRWLARRLVADGLCVVTYAAIGSLGPAGRGITPGIDLAALAPDTIGTRPSSTALGPLLAHLAELAADEHTPVAGHLDLGRVVVGGHSAGGTAALHNSETGWVPGLQAVFAYGAHTMVATALGHGEAAVISIPAKVPIMLLAGADDRVIAASRDRYRSDDGAHEPVRRTFAEAIHRQQGDSWLVELAGAGHFAICDPVDTTSGRSFLETDSAKTDPAVRELLGDLIAAFIAASLARPSGVSMEQLVDRPSVRHWDRR